MAWPALLVLWANTTVAANGAEPQPISSEKLLHTVLAEPAAVIAQARVLSGQFTQQRQLAGLPKPLSSQGDFILARELGVYWRTRQPFSTELAVTHSGLKLRDERGEKSITARQQPALRMIMDLFDATFKLDVSRLERQFELSASSTDGHWQLRLKPKQKNLAGKLREILIFGSKYVERIELSAAENDWTRIELSGIEPRDTAPTAEERALFQ